jgi:hypothetical protein
MEGKKKLSLNKETLSILTDDQTNMVGGGATVKCTNYCLTSAEACGTEGCNTGGCNTSACTGTCGCPGVTGPEVTCVTLPGGNCNPQPK